VVIPRFDAADIKRYYDRHTASFIRFGQGRASIHRAVWGPGTRTQEEAFHYVDDQIAALVRQAGTPPSAAHVVDLGCGVGASLCYLAERLPIHGTGITLSSAQAQMARQFIEAAGLSQRVECLEGDFTNLPATIRPADVAYAIESFVHGPSPQRFFEQSHRVLKAGGRLLICDDVRAGESSPESTRVVEEFTRGWHINTLLTRNEMIAIASGAGFEHESSVDLTPLLELSRPRDRAIAVSVALLKWLPYAGDRYDYVIGGDALQTCLTKGWIRYEVNVFRSR
jgi:cyclopropane fatty-acyl-phospholipid synthase-like methyltransferase